TSSPDNNQRNRQIKDWLRPARDDSRAPGEGHSGEGRRDARPVRPAARGRDGAEGSAEAAPRGPPRGDLAAPPRATVLRGNRRPAGRTEAAARKLWLRALERLEQEREPSP